MFPESDNVKLYPNGERAGDFYGSMPIDGAQVNGQMYSSFDGEIYAQDADAGVFPGVKIECWEMHEVPTGVELQSAIVGIDLGRGGEKPLEEFRWGLGDT